MSAWRTSAAASIPTSPLSPKPAAFKSYRVEKTSDLNGTLEQAFAYPGPVLIDVLTAKEELAMPLQIKMEQAKGFNLYLYMLLNGRSDEVVELAKTNWLR